jgi:hypothetical protein
MFEERNIEELKAEIGRDIENMLVSLEVLDGRMKSYAQDSKDYPRPDYESHNDLILNYERSHPNGWNRDLRFRYDRLLEKRACYEDTWFRWYEDAGLQYLKP